LTFEQLRIYAHVGNFYSATISMLCSESLIFEIEYFNTVNNVPEERASLVDETSSLDALLKKLRYRVEEARSNEPWYKEVKLLALQNGLA